MASGTDRLEHALTDLRLPGELFRQDNLDQRQPVCCAPIYRSRCRCLVRPEENIGPATNQRDKGKGNKGADHGAGPFSWSRSAGSLRTFPPLEGKPCPLTVA